MDLDLEDLLSDAALVRLRAVLEERTDAILTLMRPDMTVAWATEPGATHVFRRDSSQYEGRSSREFVHPQDLPSFQRAFDEALAGGTSQWEGRAIDADGAWVIIRVIFWPVRQGRAVVTVTVAP